jgi:clan AA aspartic protease (TIGR02281 family)
MDSKILFMKKFFPFVFVFYFNLIEFSFGQTTIQLEKQGGVYTVPCKVNGLELRFIFDTGASDVTISLTEASFMKKNGYLVSSDIIGNEKFMDATGKISEGTVINLREIEFAGLKLTNVRATIVHELGAPLLLGQSALSKLGKIQFDYKSNTLTINSFESNHERVATFSETQTFTPDELETGILDDRFPNAFGTKVQKRGFLRSFSQDLEDNAVNNTGIIIKEYKLLDGSNSYIDAFMMASVSNGYYDLMQIDISYYEGAKSEYDVISLFIRKAYTKEKSLMSKDGNFIEIYSTSMGNYFAITKHTTKTGEVIYDIIIMNLSAYKEYLANN